MKIEQSNNNLKMVVAPAIKGMMIQNFSPLIKIVEKITDYKIDIVETETYQDAADALVSGSAEIAWLGASKYLEISNNRDLEAFAVAVRGEKEVSTYRTIFISSITSKISNLSDVKGTRIAFSQKGSTSGEIVPKYELKKRGLDPADKNNFKELIYAVSSKEAINLLINKKCDIVALSEINYYSLIKNRKINKNNFRIIHKSAAIPGAPLVFSKEINAETKQKLKTAILSAHKYGEVGGYGENIVRYKSVESARKDFIQAYLKPQWGIRIFLSIAALILLIVLISFHLQIDPFRAISNSYAYLGDLLQRLLPPDFTDFKELLMSMVETLEIGMMGTVLAVVLSIPLALFSAKNIVSNVIVYHCAKFITIFFRAIPEFIMAMILVIAVGFGALPGILALGLHTMGFLAKFYAEEIEHVSPGPIEAIKVTGANRYQIIMFAIIPQVIPSFVGFTLYILDRNIRMATMLGIVGAGGIGYRLQSSFRMFRYREVSAIIIIIFVTIYIIDMISSKIRLSLK